MLLTRDVKSLSMAASLKQAFLLFAAFFLFGSFAIGQYQERALERARSVKMLIDDREAVRKIFHDFNLEDSDETSDEFSFGDTQVEVTYSSGDCEDSHAVWDVISGRVVAIQIDDEIGGTLLGLRIDGSKLVNEKMFADDENQFLLHSKVEGIAFRVRENKVRGITVFPSVRSKAKICKSDFAKDFVVEKSWFGKVKIEDRSRVIFCPVANVTDLELSHSEFAAFAVKVIDVTTTAVDPEDDPLVYVYTVNGGRVVGTGPKVKWDLTGVRPGTYTITAGVDDGCGICGQTKTRTVVVR